MNKSPNFLIIGAARSGDTDLHHYFNQHPQVFLSPKKETNFFSIKVEKISFSGPRDDNDVHINSIILDKGMIPENKMFWRLMMKNNICETVFNYLVPKIIRKRIKEKIEAVNINEKPTLNYNDMRDYQFSFVMKSLT